MPTCGTAQGTDNCGTCTLNSGVACGPVMGHWEYSTSHAFYATHCGGIDPIPSGPCVVGNVAIRFTERCADPASADEYECVP